MVFFAFNLIYEIGRCLKHLPISPDCETGEIGEAIFYRFVMPVESDFCKKGGRGNFPFGRGNFPFGRGNFPFMVVVIFLF